MDLDKLVKKLNLSQQRGIIYNDNTWLNNNVFSNEHKNKLAIINPDAVYHFNNQPFLLFFDYQKKNKKREKENIVFKQVWSWDIVPAIFIIDKKGSLTVYNAFHYQNKLNKLQEIKPDKKEDETNVFKQFSFWELESGRTLNWLEDKGYLKKEKRANQVLNSNIKTAREHLMQDKKNPVSPEFTNVIVLRLIFIRYLIDRNVKINKKIDENKDKKYISGQNIFEHKQSFYKLIKNKKILLSFFEYLKDRFNGSLFDTANDPDIDNSHLEYLSDFFASNLEEKQHLIKGEGFDIFDFSIIPVEIISGIYESVIDKKTRKILSAVYTPLFLVDYILNKTVDKHLNPILKEGEKTKQIPNCKVIDPSCGSGIFLTQTYKRIVENEISKKGKELSDDRLIEIATKNLFGIDKDINALQVTAFSIYISILDFKNPAEIDNFKLPNLIDNNLFHNDFFNEEKTDEEIRKTKELKYHFYNKKLSKQKFDFILGNPPWGNKSNKEEDWFHLNYKKIYKLPLSNNEISQSFLFRSKDFQTKKTKCALIVSSKAFYNSSKEGIKKDFKKVFFQNYLVYEFFDLSASRRMIFEKKTAPAIVVFYKYSNEKEIGENIINYNSVKPNRFLKELKIIVIEEQDRKKIQQQNFIDHSWTMKFALYGNSYDFYLSKSLLETNSLKVFLDSNSENIFYGDGIKKRTKSDDIKLTTEELKKIKPFKEIKDINLIETDHINLFYTPILNNKPKDTDLWIKGGKNIKLYKGDRILLKARSKNESDLFVSYSNYDSIYREKTLGISTLTEKNNIKTIYGYLISNLSNYYQFLTSGSWGVFYPEVLQNEFLSLPYKEPENKEEFVKYVEKFINLFKNHYKKGFLKGDVPTYENSKEFRKLFDKINQLVNQTYNLTSIEEDMIDYVLDVSRYQFQYGKLDKILKPLKNNENDKKYLKKYASVFYAHFSETYSQNGEFFKIEILDLGYFIAMKFVIVKEKPSKSEEISFSYNKNEKDLFKILTDKFGIEEENEQSLANEIFIQKNIKGFEPDFFYIIKPNELKSWHKAMAHYDVTEFKNEIMKAESELINRK